MRHLFFAAFDDLCAYEGANIRNGTSERNLCQRLKRYPFAADLRHYRADCEYNPSNDGRVKTVAGQDITCDIILHGPAHWHIVHSALVCLQQHNVFPLRGWRCDFGGAP